MAPLRSLQPLGLIAARAVLASVTLGDPSDVIPASDWAEDNAIIPDYNVPFLEYQPSDSESLLTSYRSQFSMFFSTKNEESMNAAHLINTW